MDGNPEGNNPGRVFCVYCGDGPALDCHDAMLSGVVELWTECKISLAMVTSSMRSKRYDFTWGDRAKSVSMKTYGPLHRILFRHRDLRYQPEGIDPIFQRFRKQRVSAPLTKRLIRSSRKARENFIARSKPAARFYTARVKSRLLQKGMSALPPAEYVKDN
jgi:hypothetical protein